MDRKDELPYVGYFSPAAVLTCFRFWSWYVIRSCEKNAWIMYRARFSKAVSSFGEIRLPQKTCNPECCHLDSMAINSVVIFPLSQSSRQTK